MGGVPKWLFIIGEMVGPLLPIVGQKPLSKSAESAHSEMMAHEKRSQKGSPTMVAELVAVSQIAQMTAKPPLSRRKDGYACEAETHLTLVFGSGERASYRFDKGTILQVIGGMLHIPPCTSDA